MAEEITGKKTAAEIEPIVKEAIDMYRPQLQADGGDMEFVSIDDDLNVHLRLTGACGSCPMATLTIKMGVERYLKDACPEVNSVVQEMF
ncbi:MAG: NifU family protein [Treponema sp.]|nr:NifU family protein [Treponema sp.]MBR6912919.1 NifU family protein [Treponema sp.]